MEGRDVACTPKVGVLSNRPAVEAGDLANEKMFLVGVVSEQAGDPDQAQ